MSSLDPLASSPFWIKIAPQERAYPIYIQPGNLSRLAPLLLGRLPAPKKVLIVTDKTVHSIYGEQVKNQLEEVGYTITTHIIPDGEASKTLPSAEAIYSAALDAGLGRKDILLALGGGVVGDLAGFCAATFYRGLFLVQVPTTLLAQVDSSVGGKVAVNFKTVKNGVGAFYQPQMVVIDPRVLSTLPERQIKAGLGEVVKYGLIEKTRGAYIRESFFDFLEIQADNLLDVYPLLIERCCQIKAAIVSEDETEQSGIRAYLNLGHTFAHAYEAATDYTQLLHGEAVVMGMLKACQLAEALHLFPNSETRRFLKLCKTLGLNLEPPEGLEPNTLLTLMHQDKKASNNTINFILPHQEIGYVVARNNVTRDQVLSILSFDKN